jgi:predicted ribosomally synthesized peptide with SipW-like signal peptide
MKKIVLSLAVIAVVATVAVTATRAYFSDTATITGNTFTAGTLDLKIDRNIDSGVQDFVNGFGINWSDFRSINGLTDAAAYNVFLKELGLKDAYPGGSYDQVIDIKNEGSIDATSTIKFDVTGRNDDNKLDNWLNIAVYYDEENNGFADDTTPIVQGPLSAWNNGAFRFLGALPAGEIASVKIVWTFSTAADDTVQGKYATIGTTFGLTQAR